MADSSELKVGHENRGTCVYMCDCFKQLHIDNSDNVSDNIATTGIGGIVIHHI